MISRLSVLFIGALAVSMATAAPLSNQESLVKSEKSEQPVERAKRAEEEIVFGNQQNKPRVMAKKSDLANLLVPVVPEGMKDKDGVVIAHKPAPVGAELAAQAALDRSAEKEKVEQAVEAAMETVADEQRATQKAAETAHEEIKELVKEEIHKDEKAEEAIEKDKQGLKELEKAIDEPAPSGELAESSPEGTGDVSDDEVSEFLEEIQNENDIDNNDVNSDYYQKMYQYMPSYADQDILQTIPFPYYRRRRSLPSPRKAAPVKSHRGARRIKRDILDEYYNTLSLPYTPVELKDALISEPDDYVPLTAEEKDYLYRRLLDNLAGMYEDQKDEIENDDSVVPYINNLNGAQDDAYTPYVVYGENNIPSIYSPEMERQAYSPDDNDVMFFKRGMIDYIPEEEEEKRYFFPFSEEPQTHWGAFVPEKRDYGEAIQRLQRLAMALSDNQGPYYREMVEDYIRK